MSHPRNYSCSYYLIRTVLQGSSTETRGTPRCSLNSFHLSVFLFKRIAAFASQSAAEFVSLVGRGSILVKIYNSWNTSYTSSPGQRVSQHLHSNKKPSSAHHISWCFPVLGKGSVACRDPPVWTDLILFLWLKDVVLAPEATVNLQKSLQRQLFLETVCLGKVNGLIFLEESPPVVEMVSCLLLHCKSTGSSANSDQPKY